MEPPSAVLMMPVEDPEEYTGPVIGHVKNRPASMFYEASFEVVKPKKFAVTTDADILKRLGTRHIDAPPPVMSLQTKQSFAQRWSYRTTILNNLWDICWKFLNLKIGKK